MSEHKNARLLPHQREQLQAEVAAGRSSYRQLAGRYGVSLPTVQRWAKRSGGQSRPLGRPAGVTRPQRTPAYEAAVLAHRDAHPDHGPVRIAAELRPRFAQAHRGTALAVLQAHGRTRPARPKKEAPALAGGAAPGADGRAVPAQAAPGPGL
ncbi:hypothetical protein [uncultured Hymenobacter sp.]|uniref:hypothetical protein n=1 Tax=uncultured Hymenobacter sp. TaxID=170016 RepID=UPI0035CA43E0